MVAWDYDQGSAAYDPTTDAWRSLGRVPLRFFECYPQSVAIQGYVFGEFCGQLALYSASTDSWREITRQDLRGWVLEPIGAGTAFFVMGHSLELSDEPGVEFDGRMFAYVPSPALVGEQAPAFLPPSEVVGDETRMPVVFPEGSRATLVFPSELGLEELSVQPDISYVYVEQPGAHFPVLFIHDPVATIRTYVDGPEPITTLAGGAEIWAMSDEWELHRNQLQGVWIRLRLDSWTVLVASTTVEQAVSVTDDLLVRETGSGFPVVEAGGPLGLAEGFGEAGGAVLTLGDTIADPDAVPDLDGTVFLSPDGCTEVANSGFSGGYGSSCLGDGNVFASIYGGREFGQAVIAGLRVEDFVPAMTSGVT
jgi:hypothetical protein